MKILWLDMETGGLDPKLHDIVEIAGLVDIDGVVLEEFQFLMQPSMRQRVGLEALTLQGRTLDEVMGHPLTQREGREELMKVMGRYVNKYDRADKFTWAGQNPTFDMGFGQHLWKTQGDPYFGAWFDYHPLDLIPLIVAARLRGYYQNMPNLKLATICQAVGLPPYRAHCALEDVRATRAAFYQVASLIPWSAAASS